MPANQSNSADYAYVLHKRVFRETSLIVELFIRSTGRKAVIAKGAQRKKSQFSGMLEPFNQIRVNWSGHSELGTLTLAERCDQPVQLSSHRLFCGLYINELIINLLTFDDPHQQLFDNYQICVEALQKSQNLESILRRFELILLNEIGYGLQLEHESQNGAPVVAERTYRYLPNQGLIDVDCVDQTTISGTTLIALTQQQTLTVDQQRETKHLLRQAINYHLDGKPLRSRDLFRTI